MAKKKFVAPAFELVSHFRAFYPGDPRPKDRARNRVIIGRDGKPRAITHSTRETEQAEDNLGNFIRAHAGPLFLTKKALYLRIVCFRPKPDSVKDHILYPLGTPDTDNYIKLVSDAMNKVVFDDDSRVVGVEGWKGYHERPGTFIELFEVMGHRFELDDIEEMVSCIPYSSARS